MTADRSDLISVVIPVRNRATVVGPTLASLAAQTMAPARIVLVDNGSTDDTAEVLHRWAEARTDTIVVSEPTPGAARARNRGLAEVTSRYVLFFDSDDLMPRRHIAELTAALHAANYPPLAAFDAEIISLDKRVLHRPYLKGEPLFNHIFHAVLATQRFVATTALCHKAGAWNPSLPAWNDYEFGIRLLIEAPHPLHVRLSEPVRIISQEDSITGTDYSSKAGTWEMALDVIDSHVRCTMYAPYIDYRRAILAGMYMRERHPEHATALLAQIKHRPHLMRLIATYVSHGGRGVAHIAKLLN